MVGHLPACVSWFCYYNSAINAWHLAGPSYYNGFNLSNPVHTSDESWLGVDSIRDTAKDDEKGRTELSLFRLRGLLMSI